MAGLLLQVGRVVADANWRSKDVTLLFYPPALAVAAAVAHASMRPPVMGGGSGAGGALANATLLTRLPASAWEHCVVDAAWRGYAWNPWAEAAYGCEAGGRSLPPVPAAVQALSYTAAHPHCRALCPDRLPATAHSGAVRTALFLSAAAVAASTDAGQRRPYLAAIPSLRMMPAGAWGAVPDLDLYTAVMHSARGLQPQLQPCGEPLPSLPEVATAGVTWWRDTVAAAAHLVGGSAHRMPHGGRAATMLAQLGVWMRDAAFSPSPPPTPPHAPLLPRGIPALSLQLCVPAGDAGVGQHDGGTSSSKEWTDATAAAGALLEKVTRSISDIDERLHAGVPIYMLLSTDVFVGVAEYAISAALLGACIPLLAIGHRPATADIVVGLVQWASVAAIVAAGTAAATQLRAIDVAVWAAQSPVCVIGGFAGLAMLAWALVATACPSTFGIVRSAAERCFPRSAYPASRAVPMSGAAFAALLTGGFLHLPLLYASYPLHLAVSLSAVPVAAVLAWMSSRAVCQRLKTHPRLPALVAACGAALVGHAYAAATMAMAPGTAPSSHAGSSTPATWAFGGTVGLETTAIVATWTLIVVVCGCA